jgi:hypothetical protein
VYHLTVLPLRIATDNEQRVTAVLREGTTARQLRSEVILDVNHSSRWIRGIELIGGVDFDLLTAVKPFAPRRPMSGASAGVTYDGEANASFFYFSMKSSASSAPENSTRYSHSITPEGDFGFDADGGLLWVRFSPLEENGNALDFVSLIDAPFVKG